GAFGNHITRLELLRSSGERLVCSPDENRALFEATIGGLGLTGLITWAELALISIESPYIMTVTQPMEDLAHFFALSEATKDTTYSVAWVDSLARGKDIGRGVFFQGEHAPAGDYAGAPGASRRAVQVPFDFPSIALTRAT